MFKFRCGFQQDTNDLKMQKTKKIKNYHSKSGGKAQFILFSFKNFKGIDSKVNSE